MSASGTIETSADAPAMAACGGNPDIGQRLPDNRDLGSPQRAPPRGPGKNHAINCTDFLPMSQVARTRIDCLAERRSARIIAWGSRVGSRAFVGTAGMSERQDLEREIRRLSEIIVASESALKSKAMGAGDLAWVTKQLGLRQIRLSRLSARLEGLRPSQPRRPSR